MIKLTGPKMIYLLIAVVVLIAYYFLYKKTPGKKKSQSLAGIRVIPKRGMAAISAFPIT